MSSSSIRVDADGSGLDSPVGRSSRDRNNSRESGVSLIAAGPVSLVSTSWVPGSSARKRSVSSILSAAFSWISSESTAAGFSSGPSKSEKPFLSRGSMPMPSISFSPDAGSRSNRISSSAVSKGVSRSSESSVSNTISSVEGSNGSGESGLVSSGCKSSRAINNSCASISSGVAAE